MKNRVGIVLEHRACQLSNIDRAFLHSRDIRLEHSQDRVVLSLQDVWRIQAVRISG